MKRYAIIGGGISGLSAAYFLQQKSPDIQIDLYEGAGRLGGVIKSETVDDCILEAGPDSFLTQKASAINLCRELGLRASLIGSNDDIRKTFIYSEGKKRLLPDGFFLMVPTKLWPLVSTDLISWPGKIAVASDLFSLPCKEDVSAGDFIEQRFGKEILQRIAEPMVAGIYGADIRNLSLKSGLPQIWETQKRGSLILSIVRARMRNDGVPRSSLFTTLKSGMETLPKAIVEKLTRVARKLHSPVNRIEKWNEQWRIGSETYASVLIATSLLPEIDTKAGKEIGALVSSIKRNSAIVVIFCFSGLKREGFGWLVPEAERHSVLACTYLSNKFSGRALSDKLVVRLFIGGRQADQWFHREDAEIRNEVLRELERIDGITQSPIFCRIYRWKDAMPEYAVGHEQLISKIQKLLAEEQNLFLTGNIFAGVGIPDCISHAENVAAAMSS